MKDYSRNLLPHLMDIEPDEVGPDPSEVSAKYGLPPERIVILSRNENPYGPSPSIWDAMRSADPARYPDPEQFSRAVSGYTGYGMENIVAGAGMDWALVGIQLIGVFVGSPISSCTPRSQMDCVWTTRRPSSTASRPRLRLRATVSPRPRGGSPSRGGARGQSRRRRGAVARRRQYRARDRTRRSP